MKKLISILMILTLVLSLGVSAMAAENTITVEKAQSGETYSIYKMLDLSVNEGMTAYTYTVNAAWKGFFGNGGDGAKYITVENGYVTAISDAAALAKAAANWADKPDALKTETATGTAVVFEGLENGYYLITSTLGTISMTETTPDKNAVTITEKNPEDTIEKVVKEDSTDAYGESNDAQIGDTVEFKSTVTLVSGTTNVVVHDAMDSGLTLNKDSIAIAGLTKGTEYTVAFDTTDGCDFEITFTTTYLDSLTGETPLTLTYTAVLNENAVVKDDSGVAIVDQKNTTQITYGNSQSVEDQTTTTTHKVTVDKYADSVENLAGAVFSLKKGGEVVSLVKLDDLNYRVATAAEIADDTADDTVTTNTFTTVATGDIVIWGLDTDDDYTLEEIEAPAGYNKLSGGVAVTVSADNSSKIDIENNAGTELPSTGGVGTTVFYALGGVLVLAAIVLLVSKKRMKSEG